MQRTPQAQSHQAHDFQRTGPGSPDLPKGPPLCQALWTAVSLIQSRKNSVGLPGDNVVLLLAAKPSWRAKEKWQNPNLSVLVSVRPRAHQWCCWAYNVLCLLPWRRSTSKHTVSSCWCCSHLDSGDILGFLLPHPLLLTGGCGSP